MSSNPILAFPLIVASTTLTSLIMSNPAGAAGGAIYGLVVAGTGTLLGVAINKIPNQTLRIIINVITTVASLVFGYYVSASLGMNFTLLTFSIFNLASLGIGIGIAITIGLIAVAMFKGRSNPENAGF